MPGYGRIIDQQVGNLGSFAELEIRPSRSLTFLFGGRFDQLKILGFTRTQLEVLRNYSDEHSIPRVAELMDVDKRTIEKHNRNIIKLAKQNFPLNQFDNYKDVVNYLVRQGLI